MTRPRGSLPTLALGCALLLLLLPLLAGCSVGERLAAVGRPPSLSPIENLTREPGYRPVSLPMPDPEPLQSAGASSLWRSGAKGFFRDQRARRVGDVLTVQVTMSDNATWSNQSTRSRTTDDELGVPDLFGVQNLLAEVLPKSQDGTPVDPAELVKLDSRTANAGRGAVTRAEEIRMNVAAVITQFCPTATWSSRAARKCA